jgi:hypothetical protein
VSSLSGAATRMGPSRPRFPRRCRVRLCDRGAGATSRHGSLCVDRPHGRASPRRASWQGSRSPVNGPHRRHSARLIWALSCALSFAATVTNGFCLSVSPAQRRCVGFLDFLAEDAGRRPSTPLRDGGERPPKPPGRLPMRVAPTAFAATAGSAGSYEMSTRALLQLMRDP